MEVQYTSHRYGKESVETESISSFLYDQELVCAALGRLVARLVHRAMDELKLEKEKKTIFKIARRDIYTCKCNKRFYVDPLHDKNCAFDVNRGLVVVTCPACGKKE